MHIHFFQHVPFEGLAHIEGWIKKHNFKLTVTRFYENNYALPDVQNIDALIIMGGSMNLTDEHQEPWVNEEMEFIRACIAQKKKVLGICLGAQLIAKVLGSDIYKGREPEIGWFPIELTTQGLESGLFPFSGSDKTVFHWHGDTFDIPGGAIRLASSNVTPNQAFLYENHVLALQFHLEVTRASIKGMLDALVPVEPLPAHLPYVQTSEAMLSEQKLIQENNLAMDHLLNSFLLK